MVPIEFIFVILVIMFGFVGLVRGFLKELGVTTVLAVVLFALTFFDKTITMLARVSPSLAPGKAAANNLQAFIYVLALVGIAFVSYQGQTLAFEGSEPKGGLGVFLKLFMGLVNGYLIASSLWYYLDRLGYPLLHIAKSQLTPTALFLLSVAAPKLLAPYLLYLAVFLVVMRVIK